ncbi:NADH-quinone oxidoreductase subunit C [Cohnella panacarvi]|uniref:NADH-quinone oxidoreductase subunit C n=1 Tax=Cohnella panacarvi TaxID=400776 RepID=UPI00047D3440|nr:NADH-quinone oxidoreductase subunit C [Cohnella panacarvi]
MSEENENKPTTEQPAGSAPAEPGAEQATPAQSAAAQPATEQATPAQPSEQSATAQPAAEQPAAEAPRKETDEEKAARRKAAFEAKQAAKAAAAQAAAEAAKAAQQANASAPATAETPAAAAEGAPAGESPPAPPAPPSPSQPRLNRVVTLLRELVAEDAVEESYINEPNDHLPTLVIKNEHWLQSAQLFRNHTELACNYLRNVSGVDYETYMEVVYYPWNMDAREGYCIKVKVDREQPSVASATPIWETANWNEREIYDLLGIDFPGHPDLRRIMMPDDWEGHPLRKDYVPLDPEV